MLRRRRRRSRTSRWLCSVALLLGARSGQSQSAFQASLDGGAAILRQTGQSAVTAPTLGADARIEGARAAARGVVGATLAGTTRWSAQGDLTGTWLALAHGAFATEIGATASALRYNGAPSATSGMVVARQHVRLTEGGLWVGAGGGGLARPRWHAPIGTVEAGAWGQRSRLRGSLTLAAQRATLDTPVTDSVGRLVPGDPRTRPLTALDLTGLAEWRGAGWELTGTAALHRAPHQRSGVLGTGYATAAVWVGARTALTVSAGSLAPDPLRALPGRRLVAFGVRWRPAGPAASPTSRAPRGGATPAVMIDRRAGRTVLRVRAPGATRVELRGDCTAWRATPLVRVSDGWELDAAIASGTQRLVLRIDDGAWMPPANLPSVEDDFGERVGLLVVP